MPVDPARLPLSTNVTLVDARSFNKAEYAGLITGHDDASKEYLVTRFEKPVLGQYAVAAEMIGHPVRIADGSDVRAGERFLITGVTGSPDMAHVVETLIARVEESAVAATAQIKSLSDRVATFESRINAALATLTQPDFCDPVLASAVKYAMDHGTIAQAPKKPRKNAPVPAAA